jgi:uncharacterized protein (DUF885 family)
MLWRFGLIVALAVTLALPASLVAKRLSAEEGLQQAAERYLEKMLEFDPVYATEMGDHSRDDRYPDFSLRSYGKLAAALKSIRADLKTINQAELNTDGKMDYLLLDGNIETELLLLGRTPLLQDNPKLFSSKVIDGIYQIILSESLSDSAKLESILSRLDDLPRFLGSASRLLKEPPQIWVLLAEDEADKAVAFLGEISGHLVSIFPHREKEITAQVAVAVNAVEDFADFLDTFKARDGQPFAVGKEFFDRLLKARYFIDYGADSLLKIGEIMFAQAAHDYDSVSAIVDTLTTADEFDYFIPKSFNRGDILDYFQWEINQTADWVKGHDFATVPADIGACVPVETPKFLREVSGGISYQPPGPFEAVQTGRFYVRPIPDTLDAADRSAFFRYCFKRGFRSSTIHEAYPGKHLQIEMANRNSSLIRRIQRDNMMIEGWALYCEEEVYNQRFYGNDLRMRLAILDGVRFRAARIIVDVKLHTGEFTYQQAVDWMVENLDAAVDVIEKEVNLYTLNPTTPMSYLMGKRVIMDIRDIYTTKLGQKYTPKKFHDFLLNEGAISPVLVYRKLIGQIY